MPEKRRRFDPQFREGAVRIVRETGKPVAQVARDVGLVEQTLANWVKKDTIDRGEAEGLKQRRAGRVGPVARRERRAADGARVSSSAPWSFG